MAETAIAVEVVAVVSARNDRRHHLRSCIAQEEVAKLFELCRIDRFGEHIGDAIVAGAPHD